MQTAGSIWDSKQGGLLIMVLPAVLYFYFLRKIPLFFFSINVLVLVRVLGQRQLE